MTHSINENASLDEEVLQGLGARLRAVRLQANLTQHEIAARSGLSRATIANAEAGRDPRLVTVVRILRTLGRVDALDAFLPAPVVSPIELMKTAGRPRQRARGRSDG